MKRLKTLSFSLALAVSLLGASLVPLPILAQSGNSKALCEGSGGVWVEAQKVCNTDGDVRTVLDTFGDITSVLLVIIGAVSVIMIVVGGIRYTLSQGDQSAVKGAKDTIIYAIIGVVVAFMGYAIVNFVIKNL